MSFRLRCTFETWLENNLAQINTVQRQSSAESYKKGKFCNRRNLIHILPFAFRHLWTSEEKHNENDMDLCASSVVGCMFSKWRQTIHISVSIHTKIDQLDYIKTFFIVDSVYRYLSRYCNLICFRQRFIDNKISHYTTSTTALNIKKGNTRSFSRIKIGK